MKKRDKLTEPISLVLTKTQMKGLERLVKIKRLRSKQQVLRKILGHELDKELGAW